MAQKIDGALLDVRHEGAVELMLSVKQCVFHTGSVATRYGVKNSRTNAMAVRVNRRSCASFKEGAVNDRGMTGEDSDCWSKKTGEGVQSVVLDRCFQTVDRKDRQVPSRDGKADQPNLDFACPSHRGLRCKVSDWRKSDR